MDVRMGQIIFVCYLLSGFCFVFVTGFNYVGCYLNDDNNTLDIQYPPTPTTIDCFLACISAGKGFTYAGTQSDPIGCYCGKEIVDRGIDSSQCDVPCPSKATDLCGGFHRLAVYNITDESIPVVIKRTQPENTSPKYPTSSTNFSCTCPCVFNKLKILIDLNITREDLFALYTEDIKELQRNLTVDVKATAAYRNSKRSAPDNRTSAIMMGLVGGLIICIPVVLIVFSDMMKLCNKRRTKINQLLSRSHKRVSHCNY